MTTNLDQAAMMRPPVDKFLRGWRKLPDELKLEVLRHVLPSGLTLRSEYFQVKKQGVLSEPGYPDFTNHVLPVLACSELAPMVHEVLYTQNVASFVVNNRFPNKLTPLPPKAARKFIRTWKASLYIEDIYSARFQNLVDCLVDSLKMEKITLTIGGEPETMSHSNWSYSEILAGIRQQLLDMATIYFDTKELEIIYTLDSSRRLFEDFTHVLQAKLVIVDNEKSVEHEIGHWVTRATVKTVWLS